MQRVLPETELEKQMMSMAAVFVEENHVLDDLYDVIGSDLSENKPMTEEVREHVLDEVGEYFFRLDMNWGAEIRGDCLEILREFWGVSSRESALKTLEEIRQQGHRVKFNVLKNTVSGPNGVDSASLQKFKQIFNFDMAEHQDMQMTDDDFKLLATWVQKTDRFIGECGILGWDAARFAHLVRLSYVVGYLDDNEAWSEILKMAPIAVGKFKDWKEFALSFIIGRTFWAGEEDPQVKKICERLLGHPASPWNFFSIS